LEERGIPADPNTVKILTDLLEKESRVIERKAKIEAMGRQAGIGDFTVKDFVQIVIQAETEAKKQLMSGEEKIIDVTPTKPKRKKRAKAKRESRNDYPQAVDRRRVRRDAGLSHGDIL